MKSKYKIFVSIFMVAVLLLMGNPQTNQAAEKRCLSKKEVVLWKGETIKLSVLNKKKGDKITWKSNKKSVATVTKKGKVTAKTAGKAKITAVIKNAGKKVKKLTCKFIVKKIPTEEDVTVSLPATPCTIADLQMKDCYFNITSMQVATKKKDALAEGEKPFTVSVSISGTLDCQVNNRTLKQLSEDGLTKYTNGSTSVNNLHAPMILSYQLVDTKGDAVEEGKRYFFEYKAGEPVAFTYVLEIDSYGGEYRLKFPTMM